jgi:hypothetical protein
VNERTFWNIHKLRDLFGYIFFCITNLVHCYISFLSSDSVSWVLTSHSFHHQSISWVLTSHSFHHQSISWVLTSLHSFLIHHEPPNRFTWRTVSTMLVILSFILFVKLSLIHIYLLFFLVLEIYCMITSTRKDCREEQNP